MEIRVETHMETRMETQMDTLHLLETHMETHVETLSLLETHMETHMETRMDTLNGRRNPLVCQLIHVKAKLIAPITYLRSCQREGHMITT